ncbi:MAG: hypothetical protein CMH46_00725 [Muricauda sp.]|nr:hypothetical protein [Allomuricauda sp.]
MWKFIYYENNDLAFWLSCVGAVLATLATIPQAWKVRKPDTTSDLHLLTFMTHLCSAVVWAIYGFLIKGWILFFECIIVAILNLYVCSCIIRDICKPKEDVRRVSI